MNDQTEISAIRRKAGAGRVPTDGAGMTPAKAFRLAVSKAAEVELGLAVRVKSIKEELLNQAQLLEVLDGESLLLMLEGPENGKGIAVFDMQVVSAVIEVQTLGFVVASKANARPPTRTDSAMCEAMLDRVLQEFEGHLTDGSSAFWATGFRFDRQMENLRLLGLALEDVPYRMFHLQLDMADGAKLGDVQIIMPAEGISRKKANDAADGGWAQAMEHTVGDSHVEISGVLHRVQKSLTEVQVMKVGDLIALPKSAIGNVVLEGADGCDVGVARLGQQNGYRALRITGAQSEPAVMDKPLAQPAMDFPTSDMSAMGEASAMGDAAFPEVDLPMPPMSPIGAEAGEPMGDLPDLPMMPMQAAPMDEINDIPMAEPMAAMPMDIEIA